MAVLALVAGSERRFGARLEHVGARGQTPFVAFPADQGVSGLEIGLDFEILEWLDGGVAVHALHQQRELAVTRAQAAAPEMRFPGILLAHFAIRLSAIVVARHVDAADAGFFPRGLGIPADAMVDLGE